MKKNIIIAVLVVCVLGLAYGLWMFSNQEGTFADLQKDYITLYDLHATTEQRLMAAEEENEAQTTQYAVLEGKANELKKTNAALLEEIKVMSIAIEIGPDLINQDAEWMLQKKYGEDYSFIARDLMAKPEVINKPGVLGGTMGFIRVVLLTDRLALGVFEDGHVMGSGIYEFSQDKDGKLQWSVVLEYMDGDDL